MADHSGYGDSPAQYLTLHLGAQEFAIEVLRVREIRSYEEPTRMVNTPPFVKGVINLRGVIVPVADLRLMLGGVEVRYDASTVVIILMVHGALVGAVVDAVSDVLTIEAQDIKPAPQFESRLDPRCVKGLVTLGERTLLVLDAQALLGAAELGLAA
jgi:purine-binding chemotaxis protein CheW